MGKTEGFGVINNTQLSFNMGLSMGATHYYENNILPGQIFYRWPGAVWYTVYANLSTEDNQMTDLQAALEVTAITVAALVTAGVTLATAGAAFPTVFVLALGPIITGGVPLMIGTSVATVITAAATTWGVSNGVAQYTLSKLVKDLAKGGSYAEMKGCYGGGSGTWLRLEGSVKLQKDAQGKVKLDSEGYPITTVEKLELIESSYEEVIKMGKITQEGKKAYGDSWEGQSV